MVYEAESGVGLGALRVKYKYIGIGQILGVVEESSISDYSSHPIPTGRVIYVHHKMDQCTYISVYTYLESKVVCAASYILRLRALWT